MRNCLSVLKYMAIEMALMAEIKREDHQNHYHHCHHLSRYLEMGMEDTVALALLRYAAFAMSKKVGLTVSLRSLCFITKNLFFREIIGYGHS